LSGTTTIKFGFIDVYKNACPRGFPGLNNNPHIEMFRAKNTTHSDTMFGIPVKGSFIRFFRDAASLPNTIVPEGMTRSLAEHESVADSGYDAPDNLIRLGRPGPHPLVRHLLVGPMDVGWFDICSPGAAPTRLDSGRAADSADANPGRYAEHAPNEEEADDDEHRCELDAVYSLSRGNGTLAPANDTKPAGLLAVDRPDKQSSKKYRET
jgi:hypothetical protein